jgi:hypothetical protein
MTGREGPGAEVLGTSSIVESVGGAEGRRRGTFATVPMIYSSRHVRSSLKEMEEWIDSSRSGMSAKT